MKKLILILCLFMSPQLFATTLFFEDFENGLSGWTGKNSGATNAVIVSDPLQSDSALTFTSVNYGGDVFTTSTFTGFTGTNYVLEFDYLGTCNTNNCGGFVGISYGLPGSHIWLGGTTAPYNDYLPDTGQWEHVVIPFVASAPFHLMFEDWSGSGSTAGDAFFDNILLTDGNGPTSVPLPATLLLMALGLGALRFKQYCIG